MRRERGKAWRQRARPADENADRRRAQIVIGHARGHAAEMRERAHLRATASGFLMDHFPISIGRGNNGEPSLSRARNQYPAVQDRRLLVGSSVRTCFISITGTKAGDAPSILTPAARDVSNHRRQQDNCRLWCLASWTFLRGAQRH